MPSEGSGKPQVACCKPQGGSRGQVGGSSTRKLELPCCHSTAWGHMVPWTLLCRGMVHTVWLSYLLGLHSVDTEIHRHLGPILVFKKKMKCTKMEFSTFALPNHAIFKPLRAKNVALKATSRLCGGSPFSSQVHSRKHCDFGALFLKIFKMGSRYLLASAVSQCRGYQIRRYWGLLCILLHRIEPASVESVSEKDLQFAMLGRMLLSSSGL